MGKKRTSVFRNGADQHQDASDDDKIDAIRTWDDIEHDDEDKFHEDREQVLLNDHQDDQDEEESDREIYGLEGIDSDESEEEEEEGQGADEEREDKTWGTSKQAYYDADEGSDLEEMREEEEEALRIQKEQLAGMDEEDFMDDALTGWGIGAEQDAEADKKLVDSVSKDLEDISFDVKKVESRRKNMPVAEKLKIIQNESPELIDLTDEFKEKSELISVISGLVEKIQVKGKQEDNVAKFLLFKYQTLLNYMTNISFYFALKASGTAELRSHPVIESLVGLRQTLEKMDKIEEKLEDQIEIFVQQLDQAEKPVVQKKKKSDNKNKANRVTFAEPVFDQDEEDEDSEEEDISGLVQTDEESEEESEEEDAIDIEEEFKSLKKAAKLAKKRKRQSTDDFGDLDALDEVDMEDKLTKKRSIRDYIAKIDSKAAKAATKYQGDVDIPYRDRVQQEKKGVPQPKDTSADLDNEDWDDNDAAVADQVRNGKPDDDDAYYAEIASSKAASKASKHQDYQDSRLPIQDRDIQVNDGQKRLASYKMLKNKGLTPHRKKENRNSRVKHRNKFAKQMKKLSSTRAVHKAPTSGYGGEMSGVKTNVIKSVKLSQ